MTHYPIITSIPHCEDTNYLWIFHFKWLSVRYVNFTRIKKWSHDHIVHRSTETSKAGVRWATQEAGRWPPLPNPAKDIPRVNRKLRENNEVVFFCLSNWDMFSQIVLQFGMSIVKRAFSYTSAGIKMSLAIPEVGLPFCITRFKLFRSF